MKILSKTLTGTTTYHAIEAGLDDGAKVEATLITNTQDELVVDPTYELNIIKSDRELSEVEEKFLEELAIESEEE